MTGQDLIDSAVAIDTLARLLATCKPGSLMAQRYLQRLLAETVKLKEMARSEAASY